VIDVTKEKLVTLARAASRLPRRRKGKRPHPSTLFRWASRGLRGVRLETLSVGGTTCTSAAALQRFFQRLTELDHRLPTPADPGINTNAGTDVKIDKQLDDLGL